MRKFFLIFLFSPIFIILSKYYEIFSFASSAYYIIPSCSLFSTAILINFPKILHILHSKKVTIEDLQDVRSMNKKIKNRFIYIFEISLTFMLTIVISLVVYSYLDKFRSNHFIENLGILGGLLTLISKIESIIGKILLSILKKYRDKEVINIDYSTSIVELADFKKIQFPDNISDNIMIESL
jgi:hypothetical protein